MDKRHQLEARATMCTARSDDAGPRVGQSSLEASTWPAFYSDVLPDVDRHDEQLAALMSPAQREAAQAEPNSSAAHQLAAASVIEDTAAASDTLPASLLELRTPSQLCCWANGCYPLPPVIPLSRHHQDNPNTKIAIQMPENAHKRLQEVAGVDGKRVQLRTIAVQSTKVLLDEEAEQPPGGKALWVSLPTADLRIGVVYLYLLAKAGRDSAAPQQLVLFASLPMLALPPAIGAELEDLFGTMIQEMSSREEAGEASSTCGSEGVSQGGSDGDSDGGSDGSRSADSGKKRRLQRCVSAPVVSIHRTQKAPSTTGSSRWRDWMQGLSVKSEKVRRGSTFSSNSRASAGGMEGSPSELSSCTAARTPKGESSKTGIVCSPASSFGALLYSRLRSPSSSQAPPPSPMRNFSLDAKHGSADMSFSTIFGIGSLSGSLDKDQPTNLSSGHLPQSPPTFAGIGSQTGTSSQAPQKVSPPLPQPYQQLEQQEEQEQTVPVEPSGPGNQTDSAPNSAPLSPNLPGCPLLPGGLPNLHGFLPDDVAETLSTQLASLATLEIPRSSCTVFRSAASACNLALSLLSNRSPSVRSFATSVQDGFSSYAGVIAASRRMHVYASSAPLVAATFSTHFGPLSADLGFVLETAERCVAFRTQSMGAQVSPAGVLNAMGVDILLLAETVEDMSRLFKDQGTTLCSALLRQAAEKLEGTAN